LVVGLNNIPILGVFKFLNFCFQGIEIYDPSTHQVKLIVDAMPSEIKYSNSYRRFNMFSVNNNTELIFVSGMTDGCFYLLLSYL
jgi:hypothetical protein